MSSIIIPFRANLLQSLGCTSNLTNDFSILFDGVDDYLNLGNGVSFEYTDSFSYSFWVNPNAVSGLKVLYAKFDASRGIYMYLSSPNPTGFNTLNFNLYNTNSGSTATRKRITTNAGANVLPSVWTNLVITYDGSGLGTGINVYKNGVSETVTVTQDNLQNGTIINTQDSYLNSFNGISSFYGGGTDEFAMFDYSLTAAEAADIYGCGKATDLSLLATPPIAWYRMGDLVTAFPTIPDVIGTNDGTVFNENEATMIVPDVP